MRPDQTIGPTRQSARKEEHDMHYVVAMLSSSLMTLLFTVIPMTGFADGAALPGVAEPGRARVDYMLHCQGCHGPEGAGTADGAVPRLNGWVARFLHVPGGRAFLIQVPGSANAALPPERLAEVVNWMVGTFDAAHLPEDFTPYSGEEVGNLRKTPLVDVTGTRAALVSSLETAGLAAP